MAPEEDIAQLRGLFPDWRFGTTWATLNTGPDQRRITASRNGVLIIGSDAYEVAWKIHREEPDQTI